jgi:AcrR family transcriptional regulator
MKSATPVQAPSARTRLLTSASRLFHERGINATGIDLVVRDAGVAKASLYNNFASKGALVVAYLDQELEGWVETSRALDDPLMPAQDRVAALFDAIARAVESQMFHGCPFTNAVIELPECVAVGLVAVRYRDAVRAHIAGLTGQDVSSALVSRLVLVYDGAITAAKVVGDAALVREASALAQILVVEP